MNKLTLALSLALALPFTSHASKEVSASSGDTHKICTNRSGLARSIMEARQKDISMLKVLNVFTTDPKWMEVVRAAYAETRWPYKTVQAKAVTRFTNNYYLECVRSFEESDQ